MSEMFFQVLFIIVICLGIFLFASWFFSCLYTEWQLDAAERARKKQEEELQVVKEQDPDGTEETNFIEETSITIDDHQSDKKNKKQSYNVQMSDATLPSNQVLCSVYSQGNDSTSNNSKKKKTSSQKQQQQNQQQQFANLTLQDIQVHQLKQQQAAQQRQIEQIKQQYPNLTASDIRHLQQIQQAQQLQANLNSVNNLNNSTSNNVSINLSNSVSNNKSNVVVNNANNNQQTTAIEMPATVEIVVEPEKSNPIINKSQNDTQQQKATETIIAEVEKTIIPETVQQTQTQQSITINTNNQQKSASNQQPIVSVISEEEIIKELNLQDKLPYRERKLEEYEFFKTTLEIIDLSHNLEPEEATDSYVVQFENAINQADARKSKINWQEVPLLHATDHITAIEELAVLLDHFLKSKFFKKINRPDKMKVIDQLLRSVLNIITKRIKHPAKKVDHQEDLLWIFSEIKENLENEKIRINKPKSSNQNVNTGRPVPPPKPTKWSQ